MGGEPLDAGDFGSNGLNGDRGWAVRNDDAGEIQGAKKHPALMRCSARYRSEPGPDATPDVAIVLPDGTATASDDDRVNALLSDLIGVPASLWSRRPADDTEHYRRRVPLDEKEIRALLGQEPDEPMADLSTVPRDVLKEITDFTSPRGTYFDAFPVHVISTAALASLSGHSPGSQFHVARFRPNVLIETDGDGQPEFGWCGRSIRIGGVELACETPTVRCVMTSRATVSLPTDMQVLRTIAETADRNAGIYASVTRPGRVAVGDDVVLV